MHARDRSACLSRCVRLVVIVLIAGCDSPGVPVSRVPAALRVVSGDAQTAAAGQTLADSVRVQALNRRDEPVAGVEVEFGPAPGGGTLSPARSRTDANGVARAAWTLSPAAGAQTAGVRVPRSRVAPVVFTAGATPGAAAKLNVVSGNQQTGVVDELLPQPLVVQVTDAHGNGVADVPVSWMCSTGCGLVPESNRTDGLGFSRAAWTLGRHAGLASNSVRATFQDQSVSFGAVALPGAAAGVVIHADTFNFHPASMRVRANAVDRHGNPVLAVTDFSWTISDPAIAAVSPDPVPSHATVLTHGPGTVLLTASAAGLTASTQLRLVKRNGLFSVVNTGLPPVEALNDRGQLAVFRGRTSVGVWQNGVEQVMAVSGLPEDLFSAGDRSAVDINNDGTILLYERPGRPSGSLSPENGISWLLKDGLLTSVQGWGHDLNDHDQVVGAAPGSGFLWDRGLAVLFRQLLPDGGTTRAVAINDRAQAVVNAFTDDPFSVTGEEWAYVWEGDHYTPIPRPHPDCIAWWAEDINNSGHVLVNCIRGMLAAFLWDGSDFTDLAPLRHACALNDHGEIVGLGGGGVYWWRDGQATRLVDAPTLVPPHPRINNRGEIVLNLSSRAFFLTPIP